MNFFEHQDLARKKTARLVVLFAIAVALILVAIYAVSVLALGFVGFTEAARGSGGEVSGPVFRVWDPIALLIAVGIGTVLIGGGSLYKMSQLRAGGMAIAAELGGSLLTHNNADADGQRMLNVVEEMAIASGVPVPPVYLLDKEVGINAFAAGYAPEDAVIGVTRGAVHGLSREQLQGVIAHEFSHILSGDMRLNLRLVAVLHGILILGLTGAAIMRGMFYAGAGHRRSSRDNNGGGVMIAIFAIAAALAAIGYIGTLFGNLIKSAVSRQREFLADASAVQFTRNPDGIAGALKVLGGAKRKGRLVSPNAPEASHMFFGDALSRAMGGAMSTHPPLDKRIRRIDPSWDGTFLSPREAPRDGFRRERDIAPRPGDGGGVSGIDLDEIAVAMGLAPGSLSESDARVIQRGGERVVSIHRPGEPPIVRTQRWGDAPKSGQGFAVVPTRMVARAGELDAQSVEHAQRLIERIPRHLRDAAHDPFEARAVILSMLVQPDRGRRSADADRAARTKQSTLLRQADPGLFRMVARLAPSVQSLDDDLRLPLLEQAMQPIASLSPPQVDAFRRLVDAFIAADDSVSVFEWVLRRLLNRRLDAAAGKVQRPRVRYYGLGQLSDECSVLLSAIARAGVADSDSEGAEAETQAAFEAADRFLTSVDLAFRPASESGLRSFADAIDTLDTTSAKVKKQLLEACAAAVMHDGKVTPREAELFRAVAESLRVPMPVMFATAE